MPPLPLTPDSLQLRKEALDIETTTAPTDFGGMAQAGLEVVNTVDKLQTTVADREKAAAFAEILKGGEASMAEAVALAKSEGVDMTKLEQTVKTAKTAPLQESWWKLYTETVDRHKGAGILETDGSEAANIYGAKTGLQKFPDAVANKLEQETLSELEVLFTGGDKEGEVATTEEVKIFNSTERMAERKKVLQAQRTKFSSTKLSGRKEIQTKLSSINQEISDIETMEKELRLAVQFMTRENNKKMDQTVRDLENETRTGLGVQFVDAAIPGGIFQSVDKIAGVGAGSKLWRKWLKSPEAIKINMAVLNYLGAIRKRDAGVAVTEREAKFLEEQFGLNVRGTVADFVEAFKIKAVEAKANSAKAWARFKPHQLPKMKEVYPDLIFPQDIPSPGNRGGNMEPENLSQKKVEKKTTSTAPSDEDINNMSEEELEAYLAGAG